MFGIFKKLFGKKNHQDDLSYVPDKKDIFELEDDYEYSEEHEMRVQGQEERDIINGGSPMQEVTDSQTGQTILMSPEEAMYAVKGNVPDGYNIPGFGTVGGNQPQQPRQQRPQAPNQNQQRQAPQQPRQQQRPVQQQQQQQQRPQQQRSQQVPVQQEPEHQAPFYPPLELVIVNSEYHLFIDLCGVRKDSLDISFANGTLTIAGSRQSSVETLIQSMSKGKGKSKKELNIGETKSTIPLELLNEFSFQLPFKKMVDESAILAGFEDGILHVTLPHRVKGEKVVVAIM